MSAPERPVAMRQELRRFIIEYQREVSEACRLLRIALQVDDDLLNAWMRREVPQKGWLDERRTVSYCFHGIGCCVRFGSVEVDFDFGPGGRHDGFDAWRLGRFAETFTGFEQFRDVDKLHAELESLERTGLVNHLTSGLGGHL